MSADRINPPWAGGRMRTCMLCMAVWFELSKSLPAIPRAERSVPQSTDHFNPFCTWPPRCYIYFKILVGLDI